MAGTVVSSWLMVGTAGAVLTRGGHLLVVLSRGGTAGLCCLVARTAWLCWIVVGATGSLLARSGYCWLVLAVGGHYWGCADWRWAFLGCTGSWWSLVGLDGSCSGGNCWSHYCFLRALEGLVPARKGHGWVCAGSGRSPQGHVGHYWIVLALGGHCWVVLCLGGHWWVIMARGGQCRGHVGVLRAMVGLLPARGGHWCVCAGSWWFLLGLFGHCWVVLARRGNYCEGHCWCRDGSL